MTAPSLHDRLVAKYDGLVGQHLVNPDGPEAAERIRALEEGLRAIKKLKAEPIGETGFQTGPRALFDAAQRIARDTLKTTPSSPAILAEGASE